MSAINLDEYLGIDPQHPQSYRRFMDENLFDHINIKKENTYVARGLAIRKPAWRSSAKRWQKRNGISSCWASA